MAKELKLRNVEFRDPIPKAEAPKTLHEADALVITVESAFFTYGGSINKLSDYMAASKPLIFSGKALYNPVEEARCGFTVPPRDPEALAEAVIQLYRMPPEERAELGTVSYTHLTLPTIYSV